MKFKTTRFISIILSLFLIINVFSACEISSDNSNETKSSESNTDSNAVCILFGNTKNAGLPDENVLSKEITQMTENSSDCSVIVIDGVSDYISYFNKLEYPESFGFIEDSNNNEYIKNVLSDIEQDCKPQKEEINIINALFAAKKALTKTEATNQKIIIFSSGLSTDGVLDFSKNPDLLNEDPQNIIDMLQEKNSLPDLSNITVIWHGLGVVEEPQESLTITNQQKLKNIWKAILKECKINKEESSIELDIGNITDNEYIDQIKSDYPMVSTAVFSDDIVLKEERIEFVEEKAEFKDKEKAKNELKTYVKLLKDSNYKEFYIIGSTASYGDNQGCIDLSYDRAKAVKDLLVDLGVPDEYLKVYGIGRENYSGEYKWRINDLDKNDDLIPDAAQNNRKVIIVKADSSAGKEFKKLWDEKHSKTN